METHRKNKGLTHAYSCLLQAVAIHNTLTEDNSLPEYFSELDAPGVSRAAVENIRALGGYVPDQVELESLLIPGVAGATFSVDIQGANAAILGWLSRKPEVRIQEPPAEDPNLVLFPSDYRLAIPDGWKPVLDGGEKIEEGDYTYRPSTGIWARALPTHIGIKISNFFAVIPEILPRLKPWGSSVTLLYRALRF